MAEDMAALLALGASLLWGLSDFLGGLASRRLRTHRVLLAGQLGGLVAFLVVVGRPTLPEAVAHLSAASVLIAAGAGVAWLTGLACFYQGCAVGSMSVVAPVAATGVVVPVAVGLWGGEQPHALQAGGLVAAIIGVILCSTSAGVKRSERRAVRLAAAYGAAAALSFGIELALLHCLSGSADEGATMLVVRSAALTTLILGIATTRVRRPVALPALAAPSAAPAEAVPAPVAVSRSGWRLGVLLLVVGVADIVAMSMFVRSGDQGSLPTVAVLASLYPAVTVALGRFIAKESIHRMQRLGLAAVLLGASMVAAP